MIAPKLPSNLSVRPGLGCSRGWKRSAPLMCSSTRFSERSQKSESSPWLMRPPTSGVELGLGAARMTNQGPKGLGYGNDLRLGIADRLISPLYRQDTIRGSYECEGHFVKEGCALGLSRKREFFAHEDQRGAGYVVDSKRVPAGGRHNLNLPGAERPQVFVHHAPHVVHRLGEQEPVLPAREGIHEKQILRPGFGNDCPKAAGLFGYGKANNALFSGAHSALIPASFISFP